MVADFFGQVDRGSGKVVANGGLGEGVSRGGEGLLVSARVATTASVVVGEVGLFTRWRSCERKRLLIGVSRTARRARTGCAEGVASIAAWRDRARALTYPSG